MKHRSIEVLAHCGWTTIFAREKSIERDGEHVVDEAGQPILIRSITPLEL
ncbi:MAG TPA: hypothetical protein VK086_06745 [Ruania sp.]|nr:hypothetical protein [Ruania sp.]